MNRFVTVLFVLFTLSRVASAQNVGLCNQILASAGKISIQQGNVWAWTAGEPVIFTLGPVSNYILTQGFHQPDLCQAVSTDETALSDWQIEVFPNPTSDQLHVRFSAEKTGALRATVVDLLGHIVLSNLTLDTPESSTLDCSGWLPGVYVLLLQDADTHATATVRFVRL